MELWTFLPSGGGKGSIGFLVLTTSTWIAGVVKCDLRL